MIDNTARLLPSSDTLRYVDSAKATPQDADALLIVTEKKEFRSPDLRHLATTPRQRTIFDGRNILDAKQARTAGLTYLSNGRP